MSHNALLPLVYSMPVELGGLGLSPFTIGAAMGSLGVINSIGQLKFLGPLIRRFGPRNIYIASFSGLIGCISLYPILNFLARRANGVDVFVAIGIAIQLSFQMMVYMAYGASKSYFS